MLSPLGQNKTGSGTETEVQTWWPHDAATYRLSDDAIINWIDNEDYGDDDDDGVYGQDDNGGVYDEDEKYHDDDVGMMGINLLVESCNAMID